MGIVHRGYQPSLGRVVAIKMLLPEHARSDEFQSRFRNEADAIATLAHVNIVRIHDIVEAEGTTFIVMELIAGPSVEAVLASAGLFSPARAASIVCQTAQALVAAHAAGVVHRDLKPPNLMLDPGGTVKVMDFGIAKVTGSALRTQAGIRLGTPYYMSPEQAQGRPVDARSDLYSLSVVLFELLTGQPPFQGDDPFAVALKHITDSPPDLSSLRPGFPEPLPSVVRRGLSKAPADRFQSASEMVALLSPLAESGQQRFARYEARAGVDRCQGCSAPSKPGFMVCPSCGAALSAPCSVCAQPFATRRTLCPFCWSKRGSQRPDAPLLPAPGEAPAETPPPSPAPGAAASPAGERRGFGHLLAGLMERLPGGLGLARPQAPREVRASAVPPCSCGEPIQPGFLRCPRCGREVTG